MTRFSFSEETDDMNTAIQIIVCENGKDTKYKIYDGETYVVGRSTGNKNAETTSTLKSVTASNSSLASRSKMDFRILVNSKVVSRKHAEIECIGDKVKDW
jgi:pSer/pThr/pTyr-binding forkhead associated (FHA) protein